MGMLDGIKVLEVAEHGFVPSAAAALAEWGADVVKVERPTGDPLRGMAALGVVADTGDFNFLFEQFNRNKRGIALNLRDPDGRSVLDRLFTWADVFITNFLPSARTALRLMPNDVWKVNPRCIIAIGSGQGLRGPDADQGGFDAVSFWARGGIAHMLTAEGAPLVSPRGALGDAPAGAYLAGGIAAALFKRERSGEASIVDVSLLGSAVWTLSVDLVSTSVLGTDPPRHMAGRALPSPLLGSHATADGRWFSLNMLDPQRYWEPTCAALGLDDLIDDPAYASASQRAERAQELFGVFAKRIATFTLDELKARFSAHDTIWSTIASPVEVLEDPQVVANGYMPRHPAHPTARLTATPMQFDGQGGEVRRAAPAVGEHTDEVLREIGLDQTEIDRLRAAHALV